MTPGSRAAQSARHPSLSAAAARRIAEIARTERAAPILRLTVEGGGCSGFQYKFDLPSPARAGDIVVEVAGAQLVVDDVSLPFLAGAEVDFVDDLMGASFRVTNPNASSSCGCGTSFAL
jgi:iron-sulfur cluster assembly accessory protein